MSHSSRRSLTIGLSVLTALLCMGLSILAIRMSQGQTEEFGLGDFSSVSTEDSIAAFEASGSDQDLVYLLKVLCYRAVVEQDPSAPPLIEHYGTLLYDRARAEQTDLSALDSDEVMLELLDRIRGYGAK